MLNTFLTKRQIEAPQESTRICPGCKVERDFVDDVNSLKTTCKSCRGTWDAFDEMFEAARWDEIEKLNPAE